MSSVPILQKQDDRTEGVPTDEVGPEGHDEVVDARTSVLHCEDDQLTLPAVVVRILVCTVLTVLKSDAYKSSDCKFNIISHSFKYVLHNLHKGGNLHSLK